jgi:hypothetical protein
MPDARRDTQESSGCSTCHWVGYFLDRYGYRWRCFRCDAWHDAPKPETQAEPLKHQIDHGEDHICAHCAAHGRRGLETENASLLKRAEAAERERDEARRLYEKYWDKFHDYIDPEVNDVPPWRQGR